MIEFNKDEVTDFERWIDVSDSWGVKNPLRNKIAGDCILPSSSVLDIGAGTMLLKDYLPPGCRYQPCDLYSRSPDCIVANLNEGQFPEGKYYDWVVMLGVIQFLIEPSWALQKCREISDYAVFSYSPTIHDELTKKELDWRKSVGWLNAFNKDEYINLVQDAGWEILQTYKVPANLVVICKGC